ncbi:MAG TPA: L,D-transpeptidase family protein [Candidatus Paceibacterota bacterium]|nr:L,D-transpeptidase family protein [Candidatus Paceibacterota bacterium]
MNIEIQGNILTYKGVEYPCTVGEGGIKIDKQEGDGATPVGCFQIREVFYRADKIEKPLSPFTTTALEKNDGWSDDVQKDSYNTHVKIPYDGSHELLWREDALYDVIVVLGYNDSPPEKGKGSAIFMHIARPAYTPTAGCVALSQQDLLKLLRACDAETQVCIR